MRLFYQHVELVAPVVGSVAQIATGAVLITTLHVVAVEALREADASSSIDVVLGNTYICKNEAPAMKFCSEEPVFVDNEKEDGLRKLMRRELYHTAWNKLVKRELLLMNHIQFENGIVDEDLLWSYLVFLNARNILVIPMITYI